MEQSLKQQLREVQRKEQEQEQRMWEKLEFAAQHHREAERGLEDRNSKLEWQREQDRSWYMADVAKLGTELREAQNEMTREAIAARSEASHAEKNQSQLQAERDACKFTLRDEKRRAEALHDQLREKERVLLQSHEERSNLERQRNDQLLLDLKEEYESQTKQLEQQFEKATRTLAQQMEMLKQQNAETMQDQSAKVSLKVQEERTKLECARFESAIGACTWSLENNLQALEAKRRAVRAEGDGPHAVGGGSHASAREEL